MVFITELNSTSSVAQSAAIRTSSGQSTAEESGTSGFAEQQPLFQNRQSFLLHYDNNRQQLLHWINGLPTTTPQEFAMRAVGEKIVACLDAQAVSPNSMLATTLDLRGMNLTQLPKQLGYLLGLKSLDLSLNQLQQLNHFACLPQLEQLKLNYNALKQLPPWLCNLSTLKLLSCSHNQIQSLPNGLSGLQQLEDLNLSHNFLSEIPQQLGQLPELKQLDVSHNQINALNQDFVDQSKLNTLYLTGNPVESSLACLFLNRLPHDFQQLKEGVNRAQLNYWELTFDQAVYHLKQSFEKHIRSEVNAFIKNHPTQTQQFNAERYIQSTLKALNQSISECEQLRQNTELSADPPQFVSFTNFNVFEYKKLEVADNSTLATELTPFSSFPSLYQWIQFPAQTQVFLNLTRPMPVPGGRWLGKLNYLFVRCDQLVFSDEFSRQIKNLETLFVDGFSHTELPISLKNLLQNARCNLQSLIFRNCNNLEEVIKPDHVFPFLKSLTTIDCHGLKQLANTIQGSRTPELQTIRVEHCEGLECIAQTLQGLHQLEVIDIQRSSGIQHVAEHVDDCDQLEQILIEACHNLQRVIVSRNGLAHLKQIRIFNCAALDASVVTDIFSLSPALECITLKKIPSLNSLPPTIGALKNLSELYVRGTDLTQLPDEIFQCKQLRVLDLSYNDIEIIPDEIGHLTNLVILNLSGNEFHTLPASLVTLNQLRVLLLTNNLKLIELPREMGRLHRLVVFSVSIARGQAPQIEIPFDLMAIRNLSYLFSYSDRSRYENYTFEPIKLSSWFHYAYSYHRLLINPKPSGCNLNDFFQLQGPDRFCRFNEKLNEEYGHLKVEDLFWHLLGEIEQAKRLFVSQPIQQQAQASNGEGLQNPLGNLTQRQSELNRLYDYIWFMGRSHVDRTYCFTENDLIEDLNQWKLAVPEELANRAQAATAIYQCWLAQVSQPNSAQAVNLTLSNLKLSSIPESVGALIQLTTLNLQGNSLDYLPYSLSMLKKLQTLNVSYNKFQMLPHWWVTDFPVLNTLCAANNSISWVRSLSVLENSSIEVLDLSSNQLVTFPDSYERLVNLKELNLENNQLKALTLNLTRADGLTHLNLKNNQLQRLDCIAQAMSALQVLDVSHNQLTQLALPIAPPDNLVRLIASHNQFTGLPEALGQLTKLEHLALDHNQIQALPSTLEQLTACSVLLLQNNQLTQIPETLAHLEQLTVLQLNDNQLASLPAALGQLTHLQTFYCRNNRLNDLPQSLSKWENVTLFDVRGNPFRLNPNVPNATVPFKATNYEGLTRMLSYLQSLPKTQSPSPGVQSGPSGPAGTPSGVAIFAGAAQSTQALPSANVVIVRQVIVTRAEYTQALKPARNMLGRKTRRMVEFTQKKTWYYSSFLGKQALYCYENSDDLRKFILTVMYLEQNGLSQLGASRLSSYPCAEDFRAAQLQYAPNLCTNALNWKSSSEYAAWFAKPQSEWIEHVPRPIYKPWV